MTSLEKALISSVDSALSKSAGIEHLVVAFSGGLDSMLLLDQLVVSAHDHPHWPALQAVHVHHGLQPQADAWMIFCEQQATQRHVLFFPYHAQVKVAPRQSIEAAARDLRYALLLDHCRRHHAVLLLGHHQDDQLETVLLQLKRGAGPMGLSAMSMLQYRENVMLLRPWLETSRDLLHQKAEHRGLAWIDDPSNEDTRYDRNFLRQQILPSLRQRWPSIAQTVARSARLCAEHEALLQEVCEQHLTHTLNDKGQLSATKLKGYSVSWQRQILRAWLRQRAGLSTSEAVIDQLREWLASREDAQPQLKLGELHVYFWRQWYYLDTPVTWVCQQQTSFDTWHLQRNDMSEWLVKVDGGPVPLTEVACGKVDMQKRYCISPHKHTKTLTEWLKQWQIPPWQRASTLVFSMEGVDLALLLYDATIILLNDKWRVSIMKR